MSGSEPISPLHDTAPRHIWSRSLAVGETSSELVIPIKSAADFLKSLGEGISIATFFEYWLRASHCAWCDQSFSAAEVSMDQRDGTRRTIRNIAQSNFEDPVKCDLFVGGGDDTGFGRCRFRHGQASGSEVNGEKPKRR
jgi:hypothetical protein